MKIKKVAIAFILMIIVSLTLTGCGLFKDFDAKGYVQALLDQTFQGEVEKAAQIMEDTSEKELKEEYEEGIETFVINNIIGDAEVSDIMEQQFIGLCEEIFLAMKYEVQDAEKIDKKEFQVKVEIQPADVFVNFVETVKVDSAELLEKANNGEYQGTDEEIHAQVQNDFLNHSYELLVSAYQSIQYGDKETVVLTVSGNDDNVYSADDEEMADLIIKILRLDEIQD